MPVATEQKLLALARSQIGVKESPAGSNNVLYNTAYYGRPVSGDAYPWCCVFQWWLFRQAGAAGLFYGGQKTASCTTLYQYYKARGMAVDKQSIRPGDLVFFVFDGNQRGVMNHIGICEKVEPGYVTTIDGNTGSGNEANGGAVMRRRRALKYVGGAARPGYAKTSAGPEAPSENQGDNEMKIYHSVSEIPDWARGAAEKAAGLGYIQADADGKITVWESSLQPLVWMERMGLLNQTGEA